jgi:hypothetical protein
MQVQQIEQQLDLTQAQGDGNTIDLSALQQAPPQAPPGVQQ